MDIIIQPIEHVKKLLGREPTVVFGDFDKGMIVLYSNVKLQDYKPEGDVYSRRTSLYGPQIMDNVPILTNGNAYVYPYKKVVFKGQKRQETIETEPDENLKKLFGVNGSFGYTPSNELMKHFYPKEDVGLKILPSDITVSHEGAHVVSIKEIEQMLSDYADMILDAESLQFGVTQEDYKREALNEAVASNVEIEYIDRFHPDWKKWYEEHRAKDQHPEYIEAVRLIREERGRVAELISRIRKINTGVE